MVLGRDQLHTPSPARFDEGLALEKTPCWADRLEIPPPPHGAWLNRAEIEIGVLQSQCLDRRLDNADWLRSEIGAWEERRNQRQVKIHWSFTIAVARHKLHKLYPVIDNRKPPR